MLEISKEHRILLHLLERSFRPAAPLLPAELLQEADWEAIMKEAVHQAVLLQAFDAAAVYKKYIPGEIYLRWFQRVSRRMIINLRISAGQRALIALLEAQGYPYVIIKGEAAALDYPKPGLRMLGDVDFLIDPAQADDIADWLCAAGYTRGTYEQGHHIAFTKDSIPLEMHFEGPGIPDGKPGGIVRDFMQSILGTAQKAEHAEGGFSMPDRAHHGLILLLHMQHHMVLEGLGLRHLCDWAAFVDRTDEAVFRQVLLPLLQKIGLRKYAAVMTRICAEVLGIDCPRWADAEKDLCMAVLQDILTGGNFGRKDPERSKAGAMIPGEKGEEKGGGMGQLFRILHQATWSRHPVVRKYRVLHPFFDVYRAGLYACRSLTGRRPSIRKLAPLAQERRSVYERLELFEVKKTEF